MDLKGKLVFVCGPTWGHVDMNRPALEEAGRRLRNRGIDTYVMEVCDPNDTNRRHRTTARNVHELTKCHEGRTLFDALVFLPGSENSAYCMLLRDVASHCGIPVISLDRALR